MSTTGYGLEEQINDLNAELREARAQIAAKDTALDALDEAHQITQQNLWQDITELRASLAGKEQEHQDFRLQNDAEWRAKLDHLKVQITAKDTALADLLSWFPDKPSEPQWQLSAGVYGADDAIAAARQALATPARETET